MDREEAVAGCLRVEFGDDEGLVRLEIRGGIWIGGRTRGGRRQEDWRRLGGSLELRDLVSG